MKAIERRLTRLEHAAMPMTDEPTQIVVQYIEPDGRVVDSYTVIAPSLELLATRQ